MKNLKNLEIAFIGEMDWSRFRDLLVNKLNECKSEQDLSELINILLASIFNNVDEIDKARKKARMKLLTNSEKKRINEILK